MIPDPARLWRSTRAVAYARETALAYARRESERRRAASPSVPGVSPASSVGVPSQVMHLHHTGEGHLAFFRDQIEPLLSGLPRGSRVLEVGAGMGWQAAMVAARGAGRVLATEVLWKDDTPFGLGNVHTLYRLAQRDEPLGLVLRFERDPDGHLAAVVFPPTLDFLRASADRLPVPDASLDLLYSYNCLEHLPDLGRAFAEAARACRVGGRVYCAAQPFYYSAFGHHLDDIFPLPWGHLLWTPEELAGVVVREAGAGREWAPGVALASSHVLGILRDGLNYAPPADLRAALRDGPWAIEGWVDEVDPGDAALARAMRLREALRGVPQEALLWRGVRFRLRRTPRPVGFRAPLRFSHRLRHAWRKWKPGHRA